MIENYWKTQAKHNVDASGPFFKIISGFIPGRKLIATKLMYDRYTKRSGFHTPLDS